ncbi:PAS domain S-box protein [Janthinobacterium sp. ROICE36]|uniref:PAS domain S-box protein n=1 Tax=Janthinobacterium sp. ROICE36 TaxID=2048670 RepID=UPI0015E12E7F|nr:PAS domain-containing protein [Janthinobacterium sp. ROICE36]
MLLRLLQPLARLRHHVHEIRRQRLGIEAQTRDSERRLKLLTDHVPVVIVYIDREHRYQFINATFEKWFGRSRKESMMQSIRDVLGEEAYQLREAYLQRAFQTSSRSSTTAWATIPAMHS